MSVKKIHEIIGNHKKQFTEEERETFLNSFSMMVLNGETCVALSEASIPVEGITSFHKTHEAVIRKYDETKKRKFLLIRKIMEDIIDTTPTLMHYIHMIENIERFFFVTGDIVSEQSGFVSKEEVRIVGDALEEYRAEFAHNQKVLDAKKRIVELEEQIAELNIFIRENQ